jgi:hypothetical protein
MKKPVDIMSKKAQKLKINGDLFLATPEFS